MGVDAVRRISYVVPYALVALLAWLGNLSWWAVAMLAGGGIFAWDWLWGDRNLLEAGHGLALTAVGMLCLTASFFLARGLNLSLAEFQELARGLPRRHNLPYLLPVIGVGLILYGLLGWSRAWLLQREERW
ncbi:hypothetical protein [Polaromonas sp. P5_D5]